MRVCAGSVPLTALSNYVKKIWHSFGSPGGEDRFIRKIPAGIMNLLINFQVFPQSGRSAVSNSHIIKGRDDLLTLLTKHKK